MFEKALHHFEAILPYKNIASLGKSFKTRKKFPLRKIIFCKIIFYYLLTLKKIIVQKIVKMSIKTQRTVWEYLLIISLRNKFLKYFQMSLAFFIAASDDYKSVV